MSWEETLVKKYKCPCGSGTYTIRLFMDDWNRSEERWEMDCPLCKGKYQLYAYQYYDSGRVCNAYLWVSKKLYEKMKRIEENLERGKKDIVDLARSKYMGAWLSYFDDAKPKKEVWQRLTDNGKNYPSLSTFYSHTKNYDLTEYITDYFNCSNLFFILKKLGIEDSEIDKKITEIKKIEGRLTDIKEQVKKEGYR